MLRTFNVAFFLGYTSLARGNRATSVLIIGMMSLAFVNLVFISSILNGMIVTMTRQVKTNLVADIVIEPQAEPVRKDFVFHADELRKQLEHIPAVAATIRHYKLAGTVAYDKDNNGKWTSVSGEIIGVDPDVEQHITDVARKIIAGRYLEESGRGDIILGSDLAGGYGESFVEVSSLGGARVGDTVTITFSNGVTRDYRVRGIFRVKLGFVDRQAFITSKEAESILSVHDAASQILVRVHGANTEALSIPHVQRIAPNVQVRTWSDYVGALGGITKSFDMITLVISAIGLAVAAITVFILIYVNVVHKRRQIGILRAIGIRQSIIIHSYIFQALFYACSGVILGSIVVFLLIQPYFARHPLDLPMGSTSLAVNRTRVIASMLSLLAAAFVAGLVPSWWGARERILKAIWGA